MSSQGTVRETSFRSWRLQSALLLIGSLLISFVASRQGDPSAQVERTASIPATVCPNLGGDARTVALLPSAATKIKDAKSRKINFAKAKSNPYLLARGSIVVSGSDVSSTVIRSRAGKFTSATTCLIGSGDQWFVGGSGALGSTARILVINSGLSTSTIEIRSFGKSGKSGEKVIALPAVSQREVRIDSLAPGEEVVALEVITRSGRVSAFLFDQRGRGLNSLGGDFVSSSEASERLVITSIPVRHRGSAIATHQLHLIATGSRSAVVDVELVSDGSRFTPVGLSDRTIESERVTSLRLPKELGKRPATLIITSTEPVAASVFTSTGREFAWSTPSIAVKRLGWNVGGLEPTITMVGKSVRVTALVKLRSGKVFTENLNGAEVVQWKVPPNSRLIRFSSLDPIHFGATWSSSDGFTSVPLNPGTELERATTPTFDLGALFG